MDAPAPKFSNTRSVALACATAAVVMAGVVVWAAVQSSDPLQDYIHTDKVRHILAFGAIGLCAGLMPTALLRIAGLAIVVAFGLAVEVIQIPVPDRTASFSDLFASTVGAFGGFGLGAAAMNVFDLVRGRLSRRDLPARAVSSKSAPPRS